MSEIIKQGWVDLKRPDCKVAKYSKSIWVFNGLMGLYLMGWSIIVALM